MLGGNKTWWCVNADEDKGQEGRWGNLDMAKALKALLQIPKARSVRVYPPQFVRYGWLPELNEPDGKPKGSRPAAMTPAHRLKGP